MWIWAFYTPVQLFEILAIPYYDKFSAIVQLNCWCSALAKQPFFQT